MSENETTDASKEAKTLGLLRWVQVTFMVAFLFLFWLLDKLIVLAWGLFAEPQTGIVTVLAVALAGVGTLALYRHEKVYQLTHDVVGELSKVTWPSRKETYTSTIVVLVTSVIASAILGGFDAVWSAITDLIYKV